ncbi:hypothetical protein AB0K51_30040 [Kitasatospora sp. NPDC049285]|uniref:glycine-rich domain-containing protein n=1 Tax=Kitasatospora sp. NPDC049285 TaxID=3157096 RepID=UPI00341E41C8
MTTPTQRPPGDTGPGLLPTSDPRSLLPTRTFENVVATVLDNNPGMSRDMAARIAAEGLKFVVTAAQNPSRAMAPSRIVDEGWHALIVHTEAYAALCTRHGTFVHHYPGYNPEHFDPDILTHTQQSIHSAGFDVDTDLWRAPTDDSLVIVTANCQHSPPSCSVKPMPKPDWPVDIGV